MIIVLYLINKRLKVKKAQAKYLRFKVAFYND